MVHKWQIWGFLILLSFAFAMFTLSYTMKPKRTIYIEKVRIVLFINLKTLKWLLFHEVISLIERFSKQILECAE